MLFADDSIHDINKWFASIKRKITLKWQHFSLKRRYAKLLEAIWIISDLHDISSWEYCVHIGVKHVYCIKTWPAVPVSAIEIWARLNGGWQGESLANHLLPSELLAQFWGDLTFFPISLTPSNSSSECRGVLNTRLALYHEEFLSPKQICIYHCLKKYQLYKWHVVFLPYDHHIQFCIVHLTQQREAHKTEMQKLSRGKPLNSSACSEFSN